MKENLLIFLIDDDMDDQEIFSMALEEIHPFVKCVFGNDGVHALEMFKADHSFIPHLVFIDINMPRMNGVECLTEIKKLSHLQHIPVYMYSTSAEPVIVEQCSNLGAIGFMKKEASIEALQKNLSKIISQFKILTL